MSGLCRILVVCLFVFPIDLYSADALWFGGADRPDERVNVGVEALSPGVFVRISEKVSGAVVNISTTQVISPRRPDIRSPRRGEPSPQPGPFGPFFSPFDDLFDRFFGRPSPGPQREFRRQSLGSGFLINPGGHIITNNHVVERADEIRVVLQDQRSFDAEVVGRDPKTDVALLKIKAKEKLSYVLLGDSDALKVGEVVVAIGNPFGLKHSLTQGIVSALERSIGIVDYDDFIQTDASINPGNSGGPLLNLNGEVVGINTAIVATGQGIGFAIPINLAKKIVHKLHTDGRVVRGWLGVLIQEVTSDHAAALKLPKPSGALISEVQKDSPAEKAGLRGGDVIVRFNGREIREWRDLPVLVSNTSVGKRVQVEAYRDGSTRKFNVTLGELKEDEDTAAVSRPPSTDLLGLLVSELTSDADVPKDVDGVLVVAVDEGSSAFAKGIARGDVIVEVDRKKVTSVGEYRKAVEGKKKGDTVLLLIKRGQAATMYVAFTI